MPPVEAALMCSAAASEGKVGQSSRYPPKNPKSPKSEAPALCHPTDLPSLTPKPLSGYQCVIPKSAGSLADLVAGVCRGEFGFL